MREGGDFAADVRRLPTPCGFSGAGKTHRNFADDGKPFDSDDWADLKTRRPSLAQVDFRETHRKGRLPLRHSSRQ